MSERVQWKNKVKILTTQSRLSPNSQSEYVGHWYRHVRNINMCYEDMHIDSAIKSFRERYAIPIIKLHSEYQCSHNEN